MVPISEMSREQLLHVAENHIFSLSIRDLASALSYENMRYGLAKMIYALDSEDVICVFGPDATITRNIGRWQSGFGYGAVIRWSDRGVFFPEMKPNSCGMIMVRMDEMPSKEDIIERVASVEESDLYLDGIKLKPDFGKGNHFFEFYKTIEVSPDVDDIIPTDCYYAIMHGSAQEKKHEIYDAVNEGEWIKTPLGKISVLDGSKGREYYKKWKKFNDFSKRRREYLIKEVLGDIKIISNLTHQGLFRKNEIRLGVHDSMDASYPKGKALFPVALRWDLPLHIFKGKRNLTEEVIKRANFYERALETGTLDDLCNINILPHGGGYHIELPYTKIDVIVTSIVNSFVLSGPKPVSKIDEIRPKKDVSEFGTMIISNPHELPYTYRGESVIREVMEYDLGVPVAKLQPLMTIKI